MSNDIENYAIKQQTLKALSNSGIIQNLLIYISLLVCILSIPTFVKVIVIAAAAVFSILFVFLNMQIMKVSEDFIDELNSSVCTDVLDYCLNTYKTNNASEPLRFFYTSNDDESVAYLNACLVDETGKDIENTVVTIIEIWRFQKTKEFLIHPKSFLLEQKNQLTGSIKEAVDEFFKRYAEYLTKKK